MPTNHIKTIYVEPSSEQIRDYALNVCKTLKVDLNNSYFYQQEFIGGFTEFMKTAIKINVKHLNPKTGEI